MTGREKGAVLYKIEIVISECERRIDAIEKRIGKVRLRIVEAAKRPNTEMYADNIECLLREWHNEYSNLLQETRACDLLNHAQEQLDDLWRAPEHS